MATTSSQTSFIRLLTLSMIIFTFISSTHAYTFQVGGKNGWTSHPSENYTTWSARLRFLINDTIHFKYDGGSDSVLVVNKSDYDGCNANNPITKLDGGDSSFKLDRSGPFYFITGNKSNCDRGQKLTVVVLALRKNRSPPPSVATPPTSSALPPSPAVSPSMSPASSPSIVGSPDQLSPDETPSADSPGGESADSPGGGSADSAGGRRADSPGGGGGQSPNAGEPSANASKSPWSAAVPPVSATIIASVVTMIFVLWGIN